ncbi:MAG: beta-N-acetylhexosaminidase [Terriglobales bacterium]
MPKAANDLRAQVGQLLIMGFDGVEMSARLRTTLETLQPAGVILFARNIQEPGQTWRLLRECQRCVATPMFLCVDMEGGTVDRLKNIIAPVPSVADVARSGNREVFRRHGRVIGEECCALGFNTDFAPALDLALPPSKTVLTSRTASADPKDVVVYAREFLRGLKEAHVLGCGKHFPGLGEANLDTHFKLPSIEKRWPRLWEEDLYPYRALHRQLPFVMVAHAAYPAVTKDSTPASISRKWISDVLRKKIGYRGLIVSDDLEMGGVQAAATVGDAAVETVKAGADIFLACHKEEVVWETYEAVFKAAEKDRRFARQVADAARHVLLKKRAPELKRHALEPTPANINKLRREIWELGEQARLAAVAKDARVGA